MRFRIRCIPRHPDADLPAACWWSHDGEVREFESRASADWVVSDWRLHFPDVEYLVVGEHLWEDHERRPSDEPVT